MLPNGVFVVGWNDGNAFLMQGYNSSGAALGENVLQLYNTVENEIVHVGGGRIADIWQSSASDGSGNSIRLTYHTLFRKIEGDANSENIVGIDDGTLEILSGLEGNDTLEGREGPDIAAGRRRVRHRQLLHGAGRGDRQPARYGARIPAMPKATAIIRSKACSARGSTTC